jgi:hypothetical protein
MERAVILTLSAVAALGLGVHPVAALLGLIAAAILDFFAFGGHCA